MKVSVVGAGRVGRSVAFGLIARGMVDELVLVGRTREKVAGDAADLRHASCMVHPTRVVAGAAEETAGSDVVILAAAGAHDLGDRRAVAGANGAVLRQVVPGLAGVNPRAVFVVVSNPVDALTYLTQEICGLPHSQVIGSGTLLDTLRFRALLAERCGVHTRDLRAYVLGEHGESQVAVLSSASVGGAPLGLPEDEVQAMARQARDAGLHVTREKGYTDFGVALATCAIVEAILRDTREVLPVSTRLTDYCGISDVCLSVPAVIGRAGVIRTLPIRMNAGELEAFGHSAEAVRELCRQC